MITGFIQSVPIILTGVVYYFVDTWFMRRFHPKQSVAEKRDMVADLVIVIAFICLVIQPVVLPGWGFRTTAWWGLAIQAIGVVSMAGGLLLMVWVRQHLRELFSEQIELQPNHHLVRSGPYALVRHPLYTAFIWMMFGQLLITPAIIEIFFFGFVIYHFTKVSKEEDAFLAKALPGYMAYMSVTPPFLPNLWWRKKQG
jgi:protein-S-isoprenylcysteine O-methyltransferase Ste14